MNNIQKKLEEAIRETLMDADGAGSDLSYVRSGNRDEWMFVEGNLDVRHLASHMIETLELDHEYEYAMQMKDLSGNWVETDDPFIRLARDRIIWSDRESRERLIEWCKEEMGPDFRLVKRRKAGKVEDV